MLYNRFSLKTFAPLVCALAIFSSCKTPKDVAYLQDLSTNMEVATQEARLIKLRPGDKLNIIVHSRDKDLAEMFNQPKLHSTGNDGGYSYYTVDENGLIDMPVLGRMHVQGLTRMQVAEQVKQRLLSAQLLRDATVTIDYADVGYYVIGEVGKPGRIDIDRDHVTLLEGLAMAGDLTINGKRTNVLVLRTEDGTQTPYRVDLTRADELYRSPVFYLQQDDLVYVEPNKQRKNQSTINNNTLATPSFWMSALSFLMSILVLVLD